jgi:hypothetical protein
MRLITFLGTGNYAATSYDAEINVQGNMNVLFDIV